MEHDALLTKKVRESFHRKFWGGIDELLADLPDDRVRLAVVKLSDGSWDRFLESVDLAQKDWRDVLAAAEYPRQIRIQGPAPAAVIAADLSEYESWLEE